MCPFKLTEFTYILYLLVWRGYFQMCVLFGTAPVGSGAVVLRMLRGKWTHV
jgi:hypothetical protein